jgi:phospholipid/cholesterol/gamma-HCH transport system ATP-binding protein
MTDIHLTAETTGRPHADLLVEIDHVVFGYDASRTILNDVSLAFGRGKVTAILGGSGCGKTTLLRLIGGVYPPNQGTVRVDGKVVDVNDLEQLFALRRRLGMLFQFGALFTDLSVYENVAFPLREHTDLDETMIRDIVLMKLNAVGLRGAASLDISEISGGMARRVALARAIALDPELIMYDEPFAGLDPISMAIAANLIRTLNDTTGATAILVSHDVAQCFKICDYAYLMSSRGKVVAEGTPKQLAESEDPEVRQFIRGEPDGPVRFHYPGTAAGGRLRGERLMARPSHPLTEDFGVGA